MKPKSISQFLKSRKRKQIKQIFRLFYREVYISKSGKSYIYVHCKQAYLEYEMMQEAHYQEGLSTDIEKAFTISHLMYAYLEQYDIYLDMPYKKREEIIFRILIAS